MIKRRLAALMLLATGAVFLASQMPADLAAQDAKADKKAMLLKRFEEKKKAEAARAKAEADAKAKADAEAKAKPIAQTPKVAPAETKPSKPLDSQVVAKFIDAEINKELTKAKLTPSAKSSDSEFIRRATLDITGVIPTADRVESFLASTATDKRAQLIDELLASDKYGRRLSDIWINQMLQMESTTRFTTKDPLVKYMADSFNANQPWDRMAHDILTASGEQDKNGAVTYFMFNQGVDKMTDSVGKLFLGVQIQCAQCHNHPFTSWKQTEYWGLAQFFYNVSVNIQRNNKQTDIVPGVSEGSRPNRRGNPLPESAKAVPAKFLGGSTVSLSSSKPYRPVLADWICTAENPFFSKSMVNRIWAQYFGRGLVNPVDDMSTENVASHPNILTGLAKEFSSGGFDIKSLVRAICLSDAYQRSSQPTEANKSDNVLYSHMAIKVLTPEQLYDSLYAVVGEPSGGARPGGKGNVTAKGGNGPRDRFVSFFSGSENPKATDYEAGIPQALRLMNNNKLGGATSSIVSQIVQSKAKPADGIDRLYLTAVARKATDKEIKRLTDYIATNGSSDQKSAYGDVLWALLNSSEFALNH